LRQRGLFLAPVDFPSVPQDQVRFRASVTAAHTRADLDEALTILEDVMVPSVRAQAPRA
jgi:7-keto-8-aminopelargonate synthetase-like enzyme